MACGTTTVECKKVIIMNNKKKKGTKLSKQGRIALSIFALCIVSIMVVVVINKQNTKVSLKEDTFTFEYGEAISTLSSVYFDYPSTIADEEFEHALFAMSEVGQYSIDVSFRDEPYTINIVIADTTAPRISFVEETNIQVFENMKIDTIYQVDDESEVDVTMTPTIANMSDGEQEICVVAIDAYKNKSEQCKLFNVEVKTSMVSYYPTDARSIEDIVTYFRNTYKLNESNFSFFYYSPVSQEEYVYNASKSMNAASTIKVPLNMLYYDKLASGDLSLSSSFLYKESDTEEGGGITATKYKPGDNIPLSVLLEQSIVNSDNTATNILIRNLGGFTSFRKALDTFSDVSKPKEFYSSNVTTADFMLDVMKELYDHSDTYKQLLSYMKEACYGEYLQHSYQTMNPIIEIAHKYGSLDPFQHDVGVVYTPDPYIIGIYTIDLDQAEARISELNEMIMAFTMKGK